MSSESGVDTDAAKAERERRKEEKAAAKAAKKAEKEAKKAAEFEAQRLANLPVSHLSLDDPDCKAFGDYETLQSQGTTGRVFTDVKDLVPGEEKVWVRGRVQNVRAKGSSCFLVLREGAFETVQAVVFKDKSSEAASAASAKLIKWLGSLPAESVVELEGVPVAAEVKSCTQQSLELSVARAYCVSRAATLPFQIEDAARPEAEVEASQETDRPFPRLGQELRLDNRWIDLRVPANNAIMRLQSAVCQLYREALYKEGFVEIHSPKIISGESEGGAGVFRLDYFGAPACLAQSPQLYKQMAISADMERVFEVGAVFRAENSNTRRHLCEFTGLDLEMAIGEHYDEVLGVSHRMFKHMFQGLEERWPKELSAVRQQYASEPVKFTEEPCIVHWEDGIKMLREAGVTQEELGDFDDLSGAQELLLGKLVKDKFDADFFIMDRYPAAIRPFYTMPCADDGRYSNSYDMFIRGQEICSGAQRVHDPRLLRELLESKGVDAEPLEAYISAFEHGVGAHAGHTPAILSGPPGARTEGLVPDEK